MGNCALAMDKRGIIELEIMLSEVNYIQMTILFILLIVNAIAYIPSGIQNESLKWETTEQTNIGVDLGFFNNRLNITVDLYNKMTKDLLLQADLAPSCGYSSAMMNVGKLQNRGIEILLETTNIKTGIFHGRLLNISFNQIKLKA